MNKTSHDNHDNPLVSVYIPTKDRPDLLKRAIVSVLSQTYKNIEIVISDDGSGHETYEVVTSFQKHNSNIVYIRSPSSRGACVARNRALKHASGKFITGLDDDDYFTPDRIDKFLKSWKPGISFLCSLFYTYDGNKYLPSHYYNRTITFSEQLRRNYVGSQIFTKRDYLINNNLFFDEEYPAWQDQDYFTRLLLNLGHAKRVYCRTYICHVDHDHDRITSPRNTLLGYRLYSKRFKCYMSRSQRISLIINTNLLRGQRMRKRWLWICLRSGNFWDLFRLLNSSIKF